jgi:hypothetical protein
MHGLFLFPAALRHDTAIDRWFDDHPLPPCHLARATFDLLRQSGPDVHECLHDGCPTACIGPAAFAQVRVARAHATLSFFQGATLPDPHRFLQGQGRAMRYVRLDPAAPPDPGLLGPLIATAADDMRARLSS